MQVCQINHRIQIQYTIIVPPSKGIFWLQHVAKHLKYNIVIKETCGRGGPMVFLNNIQQIRDDC